MQIKLGPYRIPVRRHEIPDCFGAWNSEKQEIFIDPKLRGQRFLELLIHEGTHAISDLMNLNLSEDQVRPLAVLLTQALWPFVKRRGLMKP